MPVQILHTHTTMSVLDGASSIQEYAKYAAEQGLPAMACTEHGYLLGDFDLFQACEKEKVKPIPGCEFYLKPRKDHKFAGKEYNYFHLTVWAMNAEGHRNLIALSTKSWTPGQVVTIWGHHRPCITWEDLLLHNEGLIIGSGCIEGPIGKPLLQGEELESCINALTLWDVFKGRMFFELMPHAVDTNYIKDKLVQVHCRDGELYTFHEEDQIMTDQGVLTAAQCQEAKPWRILGFTVPRRQQDAASFIPWMDREIQVEQTSWEGRSRTFLGNQCCYPAPDGGHQHACMQLHVNAYVAKLARQLGGPLLLTLDSHFVAPEKKMVQDILLQNGNKDGWRFNTTYYQMNTEQAWEAWMKNHSRIPGFEAMFQEGVENNTALVNMVEPIKLDKKLHLPEVEFPVWVQGETYDEKLKIHVMGLIAEYGRLPQEEPKKTEYLNRLAKELAVIAENPTINFLPYFITVHDVCRYARSQGVLVGPGRGSAAGCLLSYLLKITHVDPIEWELSFERFLSLGRIARGKFPDIDLDFGNPKIVVEWLYQQHGERFARICTTGTMKPKGAIRDVCRILLNTGSDPAMSSYVNQACEQLPKTFPPNTDPKKWLYGHEDKDTGEWVQGVIEDAPMVKQLFQDFPQVKECVDQILDVPRSLGRHASAYVLGDVPIGSIVPMCIISDERCTQFTMGPVEKMGLIKFDFLGINTLNDIASCLKLIKDRHGIELDPWHLPECSPHTGDHVVMERFKQGRTETVFQFNSAIATGICRSTLQDTVLGLANVTANGRPGTMYALMEDGETTLIQAWVEICQGKREVEYLHPDLEPILKPTQGIYTYQEQLMNTFTRLFGWSEEKADYVREIVGKKKPEDLAKILPEIREGLVRIGWTESQAESFISVCKAAAGYSFNKSHSACYAIIGYACQYLKTYYPLEWWNAVLSNSSNDDLKKSANHCRDLVVPPNINTSDLSFYIIDDGLGKLVFPIGMVKNVKGAGPIIVAARQVTQEDGSTKDVPFSSLEDFYNRIDRRKCNSKAVGSLIWAGAFDYLYPDQGVLIRNDLWRDYLKIKKDKKKLADFKDLTEEEILLKQTELLAIGSADFVDLVRRKTQRRIIDPGEVAQYELKNTVTVAGVVQRVVHTKTKKTPARPMGFMDVVNEGNVVSVTVFPNDYEKFKPFMKENQVLIITGEVNSYQGKPKGLIALDIEVFQSEELDESEETCETGPGEDRI